MKVKSLLFNKPVYLGAAILDISKTLMYDFHYEYIKPKYGDKARLLFTDTDSLMYAIQTDDFYDDIKADVEEKFDTSNYPEVHESGIKTGVNKKVIGMFKDEAGGKLITDFVGLRAKLYSYKLDGDDVKKCKGVKGAVVKNCISYDDYLSCLMASKKVRSYRKEGINVKDDAISVDSSLLSGNVDLDDVMKAHNEANVYRGMTVFRSHKHNIYTEKVNKVALSADDDKRVILDDGIHTLAYGHKNSLE